MANKRATILCSTNELNGLYIDGLLIQEGHKLEDGNRFFLLEIAEKYNLKSKDFQIKHMESEDDDDISNIGNMYPYLSDYKSDY